jgi:hypothetical protein
MARRRQAFLRGPSFEGCEATGSGGTSSHDGGGRQAGLFLFDIEHADEGIVAGIFRNLF